MSGLFQKISQTLRRLGKKAQPVAQPMHADRRGAPRFICSVPVLWEIGRESGDGTLREVSASGLRLRTHRAFIVGKTIRVRPLQTDSKTPLSTDVAIGTVVYSRARGGSFEVGVEFINPERISRFAWMAQLVRGSRTKQPIGQVSQDSGQPLHLVNKGEKLPHKPHRIV